MQSGALLQYDWFFTEEGDKEPTVCITTAAFFILLLFLIIYFLDVFAKVGIRVLNTPLTLCNP